MTPEELAVILESHKKWLSGDGGERADLQRADLQRANLQRANLTGADLTEANLTGADLTEANLTGANLRRANLTGADLRRANLTGADLRGADLTGANLRRANLTWADLTEANLDFSCLPLWCGSLGIKVDERLFSQFAYHLCRMDVPTDMVQYQDALRDIAREFHRFDECHGFPEKKGDE